MARATDYMLTLLGSQTGRRAPAPTYEAITDGLMVTATEAIAWFAIPTANTDLFSAADTDEEIRSVVSVAAKVLQGRRCHMKVVWSTLTGEQYAESVEGQYSAGEWKRWVDARAEAIDRFELPQRHVFLGVVIETRAAHDTSRARRGAGASFGVSARGVSDRDLQRYVSKAIGLGRQLRSTKLQAELATAESLSWLLAREQHRRTGAIPKQGTIEGASLAVLTRGRVMPQTDHLRIYDTSGDIAAYTAVLPLTDFPEEVDVASERSQWLRMLSEVTRIADNGDELPVIVEASVRFEVLTGRDARRLVGRAADLAKEQRRSAGKGSAGDPGQDIEDSEAIAGGLLTEMKNDGVYIVRSHPRMVVSAETYDDLNASVEAVIGFYADSGIDVSRGADEQRELWLETLPGDRVRVDDLGHVQDGPAFFGSLFWGGSALPDPGPAIGQIAGSTPGVHRMNIIRFAREGQSTTVGIFGRSGKGKSTLMELLALDAAFSGAWVNLIDVKGDLGGCVTVAQEYGLPATLLQLDGNKQSGALDLFQALPLDDAPGEVANQLALLAPVGLRAVAEQVALQAALQVASGTRRPSANAVIAVLAASDDDATRQLGLALQALSQTPLGKLVMGPLEGVQVLQNKPGLWNIQLPPGIQDPPADQPVSEWDQKQKLSVAVQRAVLTHSMHITSSQQMLSMPKLVAMPEVHRILRMSDGQTFLDQTARTGRANGTHLVLDSQDAEGVAGVEGLVEQLVAVYGFQLQSVAQQDALAAMLHLPEDEGSYADNRRLIGSLSVPDRGRGDIKGDALVWVADSGTGATRVQIELPNERIRKQLNTNPSRGDEIEAEDEEREAIAS
ncbi:ATP-binding protein [Curtobacterium sp. MCLR17_054]|uniref:ATP-binding protein n=1 Tax=Curtobacterium sp. MCLR17_054 TaxID=2175632 RepID=UPI000DA6E16B|nr:ATP-binding protein [Curtobacterium sp. MCLR17_054]WIE70344.1 ATP-binding protein [Curtobacterium sp. MCLR17_054]